MALSNINYYFFLISLKTYIITLIIQIINKISNVFSSLKVLAKHLGPNVRVVTPKFLHETGDGLKSKMLFAKFMRGTTARWAIENKVDDPDRISEMDYEGYKYRDDLSSENSPVFIAPKDFTLLGRFKKL